MSDEEYRYDAGLVEVLRMAVVNGWREGGWHERLLVAMLVFGLVATAVTFVFLVSGLVLGW